MEINYSIVGLILLVTIFLIIFLIRKNKKDKKKLESDLNQSELKPEKHGDDQAQI